MRNREHPSGIRSQRGAILPTFAVVTPLLIVLISFVVDIGNWFEHKRHLQLQADAGVLAAGGLFTPCGTATTEGERAAANAAIEGEARKYAGDEAFAGSYNRQVGGSNKGTIALAFNNTAYPNGQAEEPPSPTPTDPPCAAGILDLKMSELNLPWFFGAKVLPSINARARVEIRQRVSLTGSMPIAIPDVNPEEAGVIVFNETDGSVIATTKLENVSAGTLNGKLLDVWSNVNQAATAPFAVTVPTGVKRVGVMVVLAGNDTWSIDPSLGLAGICTQPLVVCYDRASGRGLVYIHGSETTAGTGTAPVLQDVRFVNSPGCSDDSAPYFVLNGTCTVELWAKIDFGAATVESVKARGPSPNDYGCPNAGAAPKGCTMLLDASDGYWKTTVTGARPTFGANQGFEPITIGWKTGAGSGDFVDAHRIFTVDDDISGGVEFLRVNEDLGGGVTSGDPVGSLPQGAARNLIVTVGTAGNLELTDPDGDPIRLRVAGTSGSQNFAIDCDNGRTFRDEIETGCIRRFFKNAGQACPTNPSLPPNDVPLDCALVQTGDSVGQLRQGVDARLGSVNTGDCTTNNWPVVPAGDQRAVPMILTAFGAFGGSGSDWVPVIRFATFYITGWDDSQCPSNDPYPGTGSDNGEIWGYFFVYVDPVNDGGGGTTICDFTQLGTCLAVMTR